MERKEMKRRAKAAARRHWLLLVALCLAAALLGTEFTNSVSLLRAGGSQEPETESLVNPVEERDAYSMLLEAYTQVRTEPTEGEKQFADSVLGRERGVLASVVNGLTTGRYLTTVLTGIYSITRSGDAAVVVFIVGALALSFLFWLFVKQVYVVALRRMVLEGEEYDRLPFGRLRFLWQGGRWRRVALAMLRKWVYQALWDLTIVGGFVKYYSYLLTPYILAEAPNLSGRQAVTLSRRMMRGHKWQCFCWSLTFLGWDLLGFCTGGLTDLLYAAPYKAIFWGRYYGMVRAQAKARRLPGMEVLTDDYLYHHASEGDLAAAYADVRAIEASAPADPIAADRGFRRFLAVNFGISLYPRAVEELHDRAVTMVGQAAAYRDQMTARAYPARLCPQGVANRERLPNLNYLRHYSPTSLVLMFFIFAFGGWLWEVSLGFIQGGGFVNRGVLHGPWLPIYGTGVVMILVLLYRLRRRPVAEFCATVVLCGAVEYFTAWYLELTHGGLKWWDYSGYFLNLHGRICAEGLLVFGVGGAAVVYYLGPALDSALRRLKLRVAIPLCAALLAVFLADQVYSREHPNVGKGVTDVSACIQVIPVKKGRL